MTLVFEAHQTFGKFTLNATFASDRGVTALFGRSGCGKTSIIRIIAGLTRPDHGRLVFEDDVLVDTRKGIFVPIHKRRFGTVFQDGRLFPHLTVRQNLGYGRWFTPKAQRSDGLVDIVDLLGLGSLLERRPGNLSGGEKQRVAIGRALLASPRLLLLDEPLAALDETRKAEIFPYLEALRDEMDIPIIFVSHAVSEVARLADRVIVLDKGEVAIAGAAADVLNQPAVSSTAGRNEAGSFVEGRVVKYDAVHRLATIGFKSSYLYVSGTEIAEGRTVRVHILAKDVMLSTVRPQHLSALNILDGTIAAIHPYEDGTVHVQFDCQGEMLQSRITALSCERLRLKQGDQIFAIVKTVALEPH